MNDQDRCALTAFAESTDCANAGPNGFDCGTDDYEGPEGETCDRCKTWAYMTGLEAENERLREEYQELSLMCETYHEQGELARAALKAAQEVKP